MNPIDEQVHARFKVFAGELGEDKGIGSLADQVARFVEEQGVAAKSIGVEYIESVKRLVVTLGYRQDEPSYPIKLTSLSLGKIDAFAKDYVELEQAMMEASRKQDKIICHELYITEDNDLLVIFMSHQA